MEYADATSVLIVGDGNYIVYNDKDLDQVTHIDYDDIPASLILANDVKIDGKKIKASNFYQDAGITSVTLDYQEKGDIGRLRWFFPTTRWSLSNGKLSTRRILKSKFPFITPCKMLTLTAACSNSKIKKRIR